MFPSSIKAAVAALALAAPAFVAARLPAAWKQEAIRQDSSAPPDDPTRPRRIAPADRFFSRGDVGAAKPGFEQVIATVPPGYWLVLSDVSLGVDLGAMLVMEADGDRVPLFDTTTAKDHEGPWLLAKSRFLAWSSAQGIAIAPGARLLVRNGGTQLQQLAWHVTGWWERDG